MNKYFTILGWLILLLVIITNYVSITLTTPVVIILCILSAIFLCIGILSGPK